MLTRFFSATEKVQLANLAKEAGADYGMVIPPGYYAGALRADGGEALRRFFVDVAEASPLPIVVYNFPGVSGGIDLDSDLIVDVVRSAPNVVGVKLTYVFPSQFFLLQDYARRWQAYRWCKYYINVRALADIVGEL